jgi:glycerol-3-phosphate dehydrogenase
MLTFGMTRADLLSKYFRLRPLERDRIAESFKQAYESLRADRLPPDEILMGLRRFAGGDHTAPTPAGETALLAVLAYFFEECDIFERPEAES